jgi:hypothetical protein
MPLARARYGHHDEAARRRRAHLTVDARTGEGARRGAARSAPTAAGSHSRSGGKEERAGGAGERMS